MCGRSSLTLTEKQLEERFKSTFYSDDLERYNPLPNFNVAPTHVMPILTQEDPGHFRPMAWGLVPFWAKTPAIGSKMINARIETLHEKSVFKQCLPDRRCLIPMDAWYEWIYKDKQRIPYRIFVSGIEAFAVAGLYSAWKAPDGKLLHTFTLITKKADPAIGHIHDRMPAVMMPNQERDWLAHDLSPAKSIDLLHAQQNLYEYYRIGDRINKVANNDADLIVPFSEDENQDESGQLSLF